MFIYIILFLFSLFFFKNAFNIYFINDDFFFLKISHISNIKQFINFFNPYRDFFYRPLSTEIFYFLIHNLKYNLFLSHLIVFIFYFIGIYFLNKIIFLITKNKILSYLTTFLYAISATHVFQLYYLGTFQEISAFTFLTLSFYMLLKKRDIFSYIFFILGLLSKENAIFFISFYILFSIIVKKEKNYKYFLNLIIFGVIFYFFYKSGITNVTQIDYYKLSLNIKLIVNNILWYLLWSIGFHNFLPDYFPSIFKPPINEFYKILNDFPIIKMSLILIILYWIIFISLVIFIIIKSNKKTKLNYLNIIFINLIFFLIFLGPILFFMHKWMVRLTIPLIFISFIQGYFLLLFLQNKSIILKFFSIFLITIYFIFNYLNTKIFEEFSLYNLESRFSKNTAIYIKNKKNEILNYNCIFFKDESFHKTNPWGGSKKLKITLSDQNFIKFYIPEKEIKVYYEFEKTEKNFKKNCYQIKVIEILTKN